MTQDCSHFPDFIPKIIKFRFSLERGLSDGLLRGNSFWASQSRVGVETPKLKEEKG